MTTLLIIRHGYSLGNKEKRFSGQADLPLDEAGCRQAEQTAQHVLSHYTVDAVYASDLSRAYDTVKPIAEARGLPVCTDKALREVDVGDWQGKRIDEVERQYPESFGLYKRKPGLVRFDGGESDGTMLERALPAVERIAEENEGKTVVIGTHGGVIRVLRAAWTGVSLDQIEEIPHVANGSVTVVEYERGRVTLRLVGDTAHLSERVTEEGIRSK